MDDKTPPLPPRLQLRLYGVSVISVWPNGPLTLTADGALVSTDGETWKVVNPS